MAYEHKAKRRVEFSETDMAGIMHFSNYFRFMETAEHAFFRSLGYSVALHQSNPPLALPRVHASCDFMAPLRFEDEVEIHLLIQKKKPKSLTYQFRFHKVEGEQRTEVARGSVTAVCVAVQPDGGMTAVPLPPLIADQIEEAPHHLLA